VSNIYATTTLILGDCSILHTHPFHAGLTYRRGEGFNLLSQASIGIKSLEILYSAGGFLRFDPEGTAHKDSQTVAGVRKKITTPSRLIPTYVAAS